MTGVTAQNFDGRPFEPAPDELSGLVMFLGRQRGAILRKLEGLTDEQAATRSTVSGLCLLTIVKHAAFAERNWVQSGLLDREVPGVWPPADPGEDFRIDAGDTITSIRQFYGNVVAENREILEASDDLDTDLRNGFNRRSILLHLIEELARHAGHADIIRESIDGAVGQ
jgi:hypothetical protein